ncbi:hypothetical protein L6452_34157 [Arctium lappa]|uniref:Uncharacterized protein n=1 Tax=Arctium lappa TaxID=4217 RepID=A0ACB8YHM9_ARCLA|nr:hypothetical protein L6452_34157 [Arctium lappa]
MGAAAAVKQQPAAAAYQQPAAAANSTASLPSVVNRLVEEAIGFGFQFASRKRGFVALGFSFVLESVVVLAVFPLRFLVLLNCLLLCLVVRYVM